MKNKTHNTIDELTHEEKLQEMKDKYKKKYKIPFILSQWIDNANRQMLIDHSEIVSFLKENNDLYENQMSEELIKRDYIEDMNPLVGGVIMKVSKGVKNALSELFKDKK